MSAFKDITGQRFGRLTVISRLPNKGRHALWSCQCDCGNTTQVVTCFLKNKNTRSCGCIRREKLKTHGFSQTEKATYNTWILIKRRCSNPKDKSYYLYGANGITVCERWIHSFENFLEDMGLKPGPKYSIDRIDGTKGYSPDNCRWATSKEQSRNTRTNRLITFNGVSKILPDWAEELGMTRATLEYRLKNGWSVEDAFLTPPMTSHHYISYNGETKTVAEWSRATGLKFSCITWRLNNGWSIEDALSTPSSRPSATS